MNLIVVAVAVIFAIARGGRLRDLESVEIKHIWIFPLGLVFMILLNLAKFRGWMSEEATMLAQPGIYCFIIAGLILNRHLQGTLLLAFGTALNLIVIAANGGYMPVSPVALEISGLTSKELADVMYLRHTMMDDATRLWFLGDIIPIPWPHFLRSVGSVGDLVVLVALPVIVWRLFFPKRTVG